MTGLLSIGDFARLTHNTVAALRHYHNLGMLVPTVVDESSGYRQYAAAQAPTARLIRRFRLLGMPLDKIKVAVLTTDAAERDALIAAHLVTLEDQRDQTQLAIESLHALLAGGEPPAGIGTRVIAPVYAVARSKQVRWRDAVDWVGAALTELRASLAPGGLPPAGPESALFSTEFFTDHVGEVTAFIPVATADAGPGLTKIPGGSFAFAAYRGPFHNVDRVYTDLGTFVTERGIGISGPIREHYPAGVHSASFPELVTEVHWPIRPAG